MGRERDMACPCGGARYADCCGPFIASGALPQTAEQLMRSRYSAYTLRNEDYLLATWHASTRPQGPLTEDGVKWLELEVRHAAQQGDSASVEFVARCRIGGRAQRLHENSRFVREAGRWFYVDGTFPDQGQNNTQ